ncbi:DUF6531 domain-containing protein [Dactylosporangium sp. NPDC050588]|uniref:DUF6531 domain-containing protein n=1 Tax=Dactylosporangium sp. NPDC050588 TaxID=3157211 RepID=UPI00340230FA
MPTRNATVIGAHVLSHSGEHAPTLVDLQLPGRGPSVQIARTYRSQTGPPDGPFGRGWCFAYDKRLTWADDGLILRDGTGRELRFTDRADGPGFDPPDGVYARLERAGDGLALLQPRGNRLVFTDPEDGGRLVAVADRNGNTVRLSYEDDAILVTDPFDREVRLRLRDGRIHEIDDGGRRWQYAYDGDGCLVTVVQPPRNNGLERPTVRYTYDGRLRLESVTDPNGSTFLRNVYDDEDRVVAQLHGGGTITYGYEGRLTRLVGKNGGRVELRHDDRGHVVEQTVWSGGVALTTGSEHDRHGELVRRVYPAGHRDEWRYDPDADDPRARGNLTEAARIDASGSVRQVRRYAYDPAHQGVVTMVDPHGRRWRWSYDERGNLVERTTPPATVSLPGEEAATVTLTERFEVNDGGQLTRYTDARGATTEYLHYADDDPTGARTAPGDPAEPPARGGYLRRVVRDTVTAAFTYDAAGHVTSVVDGKGAATGLVRDAHGDVTELRSRAGDAYRQAYTYDLNGNLVERTVSFVRGGFDGAEATDEPAVVVERFAYNDLNNPIRRTVAGEGLEQVTVLERDAAENVVREVDPTGAVTTYSYDERNLPVAAVAADGTALRWTYTANGQLESETDGRGHTTRFRYDGLHRYAGYDGPDGTSLDQWRDAADRVVRVRLTGDAGNADPAVLAEAFYAYDELDRLVRVDRSWHDPATGAPLGANGLVSAFVEYGVHSKPVRWWTPAGGALTMTYDGANRITSVTDESGLTAAVGYDENSNPVHLRRGATVVTQTFDELDQLRTRRLGDDPADLFVHNGLGRLVGHVDGAGGSTRYVHDGLGRPTGRVRTAAPGQVLFDQVSYDEAGRVTARTDAAGNLTRATYGPRGLATVIEADGAVTAFERDAGGDVVRLTQPDGTVVTSDRDPAGRLVTQAVTAPGGVAVPVTALRYDGLGRMTSTWTPDASTAVAYDSLGRPLTETQSGRTIRYSYDTAGNLTGLVYPSGRRVSRAYDRRGRLTGVAEDGVTIVSYEYDADGRPVTVHFGTSLVAELSYATGTGRLTALTYRSPGGTVVDAFSYLFDDARRPVAEDRSGTGDRFGYDAAGRLTSASYGDSGVSVRYELGPLGLWERRVETLPDGTEVVGAATVNARGAYLTAGGTAYTYDDNGRRTGETTDGTGRTYEYDHDGQVVGVGDVDGGGVIRYGYDAHGRQVGRNGVTRVWSGDHLLEEWDGERLLRSYTYGDGPGQPVQVSTGDGARSTYVLSGRGLIAGLMDASGAPARRYSYDAYGRPTGSAADGALLGGAVLWDPGAGLYYTRSGGGYATTSMLPFKPPKPDPRRPGVDYRDAWDKMSDVGEGLIVLGIIGEFFHVPGSEIVLLVGAVLVAPHQVDKIGQRFGWWGPPAAKPAKPGDHSGRSDGFGDRFGDGFGGLGDGFGYGGPGYGGPGHSGGGYGGSGYGGTGYGSPGGADSGGGYGGGEPAGPWGDRPDREPSGSGSGSGGPRAPEYGDPGGGSSTPESPEPTPKPDPKPSGGSGGGGSGGSGGGKKDEPKGGGDKPVPDDKTPVPPGTPIATPNPVDGTGEGVDKDWWRGLPGRSALTALSGTKVDEREATPLFQPPTAASVVEILAPRFITKDEGGEGVTINLHTVHSAWVAGGSGSSSSDGWGDKPHTLAESLAAPRIRDASIARF